MDKIIAIGGGQTFDENKLINKEIIKLTGKSNPKILFIPTASGDAVAYYEKFVKHFGNELGAKCDVLYLITDKPEWRAIKHKILSSDAIYVGGGNTLIMLKLWRKMGVDKLLKEAYKKGVVLSGLSAGSICWFQYGHSDSLSFSNKKWEYIRINGLGLIKGIHCPHFNGQSKYIKRRKNFKKFMKRYPDMGIALDNNCAIEFINNKYRVISTKIGRKGYKVYKKDGNIIASPINESKEFRPIKNIYIKE